MTKQHSLICNKHHNEKVMQFPHIFR